MPIDPHLSSNVYLACFGWPASSLPDRVAGREGRAARLRPSRKPALPCRLKRAAGRGCVAAALSRPWEESWPPPPLPVHDGGRLYLALLPRLLEAEQPRWREQPLLLPAHTRRDCALAWRVAQAGGRLALQGPWASSLAEALYARLGLVCPLSDGGGPSPLPSWPGGLPPAVVEAALCLGERPSLRQLERDFFTAGYCLEPKTRP